MCSRSTTGQATPANGPSWLTFIAQTKDSLWSLDLFRRESILVRSHWVLVVMDVFTRRIIGFGVERAYIAHHHHLTVHRQECRPAAERQRGLDGNAMDRHLQIGSRETVTMNLTETRARNAGPCGLCGCGNAQPMNCSQSVTVVVIVVVVVVVAVTLRRSSENERSEQAVRLPERSCSEEERGRRPGGRTVSEAY